MKKKQIHKESRKREQAVAKEMEGKRHAGSGSVWWSKGDVSNAEFLIEDKFTVGISYVLSSKVLNKLEQQASAVNKLPVLRFGFYTGKDFAVLRAQDCVYGNNVELTQSFTQSHRFYLQDLTHYFLYAKCDYMHITFANKKYVKYYYIIEWERFLEIKEKISKGAKI